MFEQDQQIIHQMIQPKSSNLDLLNGVARNPAKGVRNLRQYKNINNINYKKKKVQENGKCNFIQI